MIDYIFWFAFGFALGFLFFIFMKLIRNYLYQRSKKLRRKAFREKMDNLMKYVQKNNFTKRATNMNFFEKKIVKGLKIAGWTDLFC